MNIFFSKKKVLRISFLLRIESGMNSSDLFPVNIAIDVCLTESAFQRSFQINQ